MKKKIIYGIIGIALFLLLPTYDTSSSNNWFSEQNNSNKKIILSEESFSDTSTMIYTANFTVEVIDLTVKAENEVVIKVKVTNTGKTAYEVKIKCVESNNLTKTYPENTTYDYIIETIEYNKSVTIDYSFSDANQSERTVKLEFEFWFTIEGCSLEHLKTAEMIINIPEKMEEEQKSMVIFPIILIIASVIGMSIIKHK